MEPLRVNDRLTIAERDLSWTAVRAGGPGGQNVNKVSSKVELRFDVDACTELAPWVKARLRTLCKNRLDAEGRVRIVAQATRDQLQNLNAARERLAELISEALTVPKPRRPTKPTKGSKRRRLDAKHRVSDKKALRGRVREE